MKHFMPLLKEINRKLDLPQPVKSRVILEISGDIEELYRTYLDRGLSENEAIKIINDKFSLSDSTLNELISLHSSSYKRWFDKLSNNARARWEQILFITVSTLILFSFANIIYTTTFFLETSYFTYPILFTFLMVLMISISKFYQFYLKKDHDLKRLRKGLDVIFYCSIIILFLGVSGYFGELFFSRAEVNYLGPYFLLSLLTDQDSLALSVGWMIRNSSMMMTCFGSIIITLLFWFVLTNKANSIEEAEASSLLENN